MWRSRSAGVRVWRCRSAGVKVWRCRSADVRVWRSRSADVKVWRCSITAAFLRRTLRRRSREKTWEAKLSSRWLFVTLKNKMARLGCTVCAQASTGGPWANFDQKPLSVKLAHLKRHERSKTHVAALAATMVLGPCCFGAWRFLVSRSIEKDACWGERQGRRRLQ